jgi:hypothetical protein
MVHPIPPVALEFVTLSFAAFGKRFVCVVIKYLLLQAPWHVNQNVQLAGKTGFNESLRALLLR